MMWWLLLGLILIYAAIYILVTVVGQSLEKKQPTSKTTARYTRKRDKF